MAISVAISVARDILLGGSSAASSSGDPDALQAENGGDFGRPGKPTKKTMDLDEKPLQFVGPPKR